MNGARALTVIRGIRDNETIRSKYVVIYNQALVLLVSHLSSALGDLFRAAITERLESAEPGKLLEEEIKLTFGAMRDQKWNLRAAAADLLIAKHDFTFQDMRSTVDAFKKYANVTMVRDQTMNNIIAAQACRHVIVHAGGRVSVKAIYQVATASPRSFRPSLTVDEVIQISVQEISIVMADMLQFIEKLSGDISSAKSSPA